ncbi:MAG: flagellin [Mycobacterium sp.]|nr:flagellin [Mycobacterium sp.]
MSVFSVNTNLGAMAALQSLSQTAQALSDTQNEISTGLKVGSAADNPAVYAISQSMNSQIAGLSAVQDGLSFGAQVVSTASDAVTNIGSTLASLQQTLTQAQQQGLSSGSMQSSINGALSEIDSYANSATLNGINLLAGATGNGVNSTQLQVLTDTTGGSFTVGGTAGGALNATSAGLGLSGLSATSTAAEIQLGAITATTAIVGKGAGASTTLTLQTASYATATGSAQNPAQKYVFVFDDGSATSTNIDAALNADTTGGAAVAGNTPGTDVASSKKVFGDDANATSTGGIVLLKNADGTGATNGSITSLGNGNTEYSYVDAADANGNPTQQTNVISVNIKGLTTTAGSQSGITTAINDLMSVMQGVGFGVTIDSNNNLTIAGNNIDTTSATNSSAVTNLTSNTTGAEQISGAAAAIANVNAAVIKLGNITSSLGTASDHISGMQSFTTSLSGALTAGVGALTDADMAAESAKLTSLQTKQQLGIQALSIANQQPQVLLKLFGA